jgi:hypothetical protein
MRSSQSKLFAERALRAVQDAEIFARELRPKPVPEQRRRSARHAAMLRRLLSPGSWRRTSD